MLWIYLPVALIAFFHCYLEPKYGNILAVVIYPVVRGMILIAGYDRLDYIEKLYIKTTHLCKD
jgi:hypothetical protein